MRLSAKPSNVQPQRYASDRLHIFDCVRPFTMTGLDRVSALCDAVEYIVGHSIPGAFVECGVWRGGSVMAMQLMLNQKKAEPRDIYLFDTFSGMPPPQDCDVDYAGQPARALLERSQTSRETDPVWAIASEEDVRAAVQSVPYDHRRVHFVKGNVEDTIPSQAPSEIALLRLDTDWYQSTRHELIHLFPRLVPGGVLIIDDYGHWRGARKAVDEYFESSGEPIFLHRIDDTGRIAVRQGHDSHQ